MSELSADLEAALLRELRRVYDHENEVHFGNRLKKPVLVLTDSTHKLGRWLPATRTLELARPLVVTKPWLEVRSVLEHEMAHQYVDEVLKVTNEPAHGPTFTTVCATRGIDAKATGLPLASITVGAGRARARASAFARSRSDTAASGLPSLVRSAWNLSEYREGFSRAKSHLRLSQARRRPFAFSGLSIA
jgi:hypothetical protein